MRHPPSLLAALLGAALPATAPAQRAPDFTPLRVVAAEFMKAHGLPGLALAVVSGDSVVFAEAYGVRSVESGTPLTTESLFQIGSMTKTFTAALLVAQAQAGALDLHAAVGRHVIDLAPKLARVTAHQLLSHTAGLRDEPAEYGRHDESALAEYVRSWPDEYALLDPGLAFSYSNAGYTLAGLVAERAGGKPYAELMRERLFRPLGMGRTTFHPTEAMTYPLAVGHRGRPGEPAAVVRPMADDTRHWPAGYMYSSVLDVARFAAALMSGGRVGGAQALAPEVARALLTPRADVPAFRTGVRYGYGLYLEPWRGAAGAWHAGSMPGFSNLLWMIPERRVAVVVMANRDLVRLERLTDAALALALPEAEPLPAAAAKPALPMTPAEMERYVGTYAGRMTAEVFVRDGRLHLRRFGQELPLVRVGEHRFAVAPPGAPRGDELLIVPAAPSRPAYLQMFMWALVKGRE